MESPASRTLSTWLLHILFASVAMVLRTLIDIVAFLFVLLLKFITPAPVAARAAAPMHHVTSLELNIVITLQTPQHSTGSGSPSTGSTPARVGTPTVTATLRYPESPTRHSAEEQPPRMLGRIRSFLATNASTRARRRDELAVHATPPLAVLERHIVAVREDIARIEDMEEAREMGLEGAGEEAVADEGAVARADTDEPGHHLDLPTQQELLAQFRRSVEAGAVIEELGEVMRTWRSQALLRYDREASRYHQALERHRAGLVKTLDFTLSPLFLGQLKNLHQVALVSFKAETVAGLEVDGYNFADVVGRARACAEARFVDGAREAVVVEGGGAWQWEEEFQLLRDEIWSIIVQLRRDEAKKVVDAIERDFKERIAEPVDVQLQRPTPLMWDNILRVYKEILASAENSYLCKARSLGCEDEENDKALTTLRRRTWAALRAKIDEHTKDTVILTTLRTYFEKCFCYDEHDVPRVWKPDDDVDAAFKEAKDIALELIPLYAKIKPQDPDFAHTPPEDSGDDVTDPGLNLFSETKALELEARFRREVYMRYVVVKLTAGIRWIRMLYWIFAVSLVSLVVLGCRFHPFTDNPLYFFIAWGSALVLSLFLDPLTLPVVSD